MKIGLDIGRVFAKCLIFDKFSLWFTYRLSKSTYASQFTWLKVLIGLKKDPSRNKWFRHRLQICVFSGLVIGWWSKRRVAHQYPTQSWVTPLGSAPIACFASVRSLTRLVHFSGYFEQPLSNSLASLNHERKNVLPALTDPDFCFW